MDTPLVPIKRNRPTIKQVKTLQNLKEGMNMTQAMTKAGYSGTVAKRGRVFFQQKGVQTYLKGLREYVTEAGLTNQKMAEKFKEWIDAEKVVTSHTEPDKSVPDYETQLKTFDRWKDLMEMGEGGNPKIKRRLTVEEFVNDELKDESK